MLGRRRGLVRTVARTAAVVGTASAVAGGVQHKQQQKYANQEAEQQAAAGTGTVPDQQAAIPAAADDPNEGYDEIERLGELKDKGYITEEEFTAKKRDILGL